MRIGGRFIVPYKNSQEWLALVREMDYSCTLSPVKTIDYSDSIIEDYLAIVEEHDIVIGEVGIWNNPLSPDPQERKKSLEYSISRLELAERLGAKCCVNVAGARGEFFAGLYADNYSDETYKMVVENTQAVIDAVEPKNTFFCLESLPWMCPDSPDAYLKLLRDVNRDAFGVHLDFVNMINTPYKYAFRQDFIEECFQKLGPYTKSVHLKDTRLKGKFSFMMEECQPGQGTLDFAPILMMCEELGEDITVFVEHMDRQEDYKHAVKHVRGIAEAAGIKVKRMIG